VTCILALTDCLYSNILSGICYKRHQDILSTCTCSADANCLSGELSPEDIRSSIGGLIRSTCRAHTRTLSSSDGNSLAFLVSVLLPSLSFLEHNCICKNSKSDLVRSTCCGRVITSCCGAAVALAGAAPSGLFRCRIAGPFSRF
jgi:hypothetical protein